MLVGDEVRVEVCLPSSKEGLGDPYIWLVHRTKSEELIITVLLLFYCIYQSNVRVIITLLRHVVQYLSNL